MRYVIFYVTITLSTTTRGDRHGKASNTHGRRHSQRLWPHRSAQSEVIEATVNIVPNEIAEPVLKAIASVIAKAEADAKKAIDVEAHKSALALSAIDSQLKIALAEADTMSATIADLEAKLEAAGAKIKVLEKKLAKASKKPEEQKKLPL